MAVLQPRWGEKPGTEVGVNRHGHNVTGCELMASCHPVKTMQNDVSGSVQEVIRHKVIVGSLGRCLYIVLQQVLLISCWQVVFNK